MAGFDIVMWGRKAYVEDLYNVLILLDSLCLIWVWR